MLKDNIKTARQAKGLSQEELAVKLHAVRQTVSKWERGLSVPDADMLVAMAGIFGVPVSTLLGASERSDSRESSGGASDTESSEVAEVSATAGMPGMKGDDLKAIAEKLEAINLQLAKKRRAWRRAVLWGLGLLCVAIVGIVIVLFIMGSSYADWDYGDPETAILGTVAHSFEWAFVRVAPVVLVMAVIGIVLVRKRRD